MKVLLFSPRKRNLYVYFIYIFILFNIISIIALLTSSMRLTSMSVTGGQLLRAKISMMARQPRRRVQYVP